MNGLGAQPGGRENGMAGDKQGLRRTDQQQGMAANGMSSENNSLRGVLGQRSLSGAGVGKSLGATGALAHSQNPYSMYGESESLDDGIHEDLTSRTTGLDNGKASNDLPREDEIRREFIDYMDVMSPMSEPEEVALRNTDVEEKWNLIKNQRQRSPIFNIRYYIENLRQNQGTRRKKFSLGKSSSKSGVSPLTYLLRKLKVDLMMSPPSFLQEFSEPPNGGVHLLVHLLQSMQIDQNALQTGRNTRLEEFRRLQEDETDCLFCLKFLTRTEEGRQKLARQEGIFDLIAQSTLCSKSKTRAVALQLLVSLCAASSTGYQQTMQTMARLQQRLQEPVIFRTLCTTLSAADGQDDISFILATVQFFNRLVSSVSNANACVHLQYELERAGFNPDQFDKYSYGDNVEQEDLGKELDIWRKNYINVVSTREQISTLDHRNQDLREEVTRLQEQVKAAEKAARHKEREKKRMSEKRDNYRERAAELQDTVEKLTKLYEESTGGKTVEEVNVEEVLKPLDTPSDPSAKDKFDTVRSISSVADGVETFIPRAPPMPPPAPPMQPPRRKITATASVELPMLNWTPIQTVTNTIFQDLDDERVYKEIDFADFESRFRLQRRQETAEVKERRQRIAVKHQTNKLLFVNLNRARNMCITKHRTGLTSRQIKDAIESCDVVALPGENAELLIKFIPTKEELKLLAQHRDEYWKMGEAEQFLFQMAQVERLESKLSLLAFIGIFDELIQSVRPNMARVLDACNSVATNRGLKKMFEIILAFGNYMNGAKRGYTMGFKLESLYKLSDVKTMDRQQTLMHYLAEQVAANYPELLTFYEGVNLAVSKGTSFHSMHQDVKGLRKGLDLVKFEKEKQNNNPVLERFYKDASEQVTNVAESFKKMEEKYKEVCLAFGENYKHIEPDIFFGTLADFANNFKLARQENLMKATRLIGASPSTPKATPVVQTSPNSQSKAQKPSAQASSAAPTQSAPTPKKEAPRILASLTPQSSPMLKPQGTRKDLPKGAYSGPVAAQHGVMAPVKSQTQSTQQKPSGSIKKKAAPVAPSINTTPSPQLTNGVAKSTTDKHAESKPERPLSLKIPERPRTSSEPSTADMLAALGTLDKIVDDEERLGGIPEHETYTSYL